jgi:hypothetical protein
MSAAGADRQSRGHNLVFVVGCPRSGTTWVQRLLASHPRVVTGQESFLFSGYLGPALRTWRWEWRRELNPRTASGRGGIGVSAYLREEEFLEILRRFADDLVAPALARLGPDQLFVDKSPTHARFIPEIKELFPAARFVNVVRDPRDVAASWQQASKGWGSGWAPRSVRTPVKEWLNHVGAVHEAERWLHIWDFYEVVYERLHRHPEAVLHELARYLELDWDDAGVKAAVAANASGSLRVGGGVRIPVGGEVARRSGSDVMSEPAGFVNDGTPGAWRDALGPLQQLWIWHKARKAMKRDGYRWAWSDLRPRPRAAAAPATPRAPAAAEPAAGPAPARRLTPLPPPGPPGDPNGAGSPQPNGNGAGVASPPPSNRSGAGSPQPNGHGTLAVGTPGGAATPAGH